MLRFVLERNRGLDVIQMCELLRNDAHTARVVGLALADPMLKGETRERASCDTKTTLVETANKREY